MRTGMSLTATLFVIFVVLKLTGNIDWSWVWVTSPLWLVTATIVSVIGLAYVGAALFHVVNAPFRAARNIRRKRARARKSAITRKV